MDLGFFNDKILINATYVHNRSSNQLLSYSLPMITGFESIIGNFPATVQNASWEFSLNTENFHRKNFSWTSSFNITFPKNKLVSFPNLSTSSYASSLVIGQPVNIIKVWRFKGVDTQTGIYQFADSAGNITSSPTQKDRTILINTLPTYYGGLQNNIHYGQFELDFLIQFVKQIGVQTFYSSGAGIAPGVGYAGFSNQPTSVLENVWKKTGDNPAIQKYSANYFSSYAKVSQILGSDAGYSDASYIRLKSVSISWQVPNQWQKKLGVQNCTISVEGQNLFTVSKYKGIDPETQNINSLPPLRVIVIGLQIGL